MSVDAASTTALALITRALKTIGKLGLGESLDGTLAHDCLLTLNEMLDHWRTQDLLIYQLSHWTVPLLANRSTYTIGLGGQIDTPRPNRIYAASVFDPATPDVERWLTVLDEREYAAENLKNQHASVCTKLFYDPGFAGTRWNAPSDPEPPEMLGTLHPLPIPTIPAQLTLYLLAGLTEFPDLVTVVALPHGYLKALRYNLAVELAPDHGVDPPGIVYSQARSAIADIKRKNIRHTALSNDAVQRGGGYNIRTDEYR